jgi:alkyl hydroperoxide reductase subunit AhpF
VKLEIFVEAGCVFCETASVTAGEIARLFPQLKVNLIDVSEAGDELPESVLAVPTYVLDGTVVSLGNPHIEDLASLVATAAT